jgi:hypothetical protein
MAQERRRGCGFRRVGGKYMVAGKPNAPCCRLPLELHVCPTCSQGIKQARGWTWIKPQQLFSKDAGIFAGMCNLCPLSPQNLPERAGLLWVGEAFYPEPEDFMREAREQGISKRISAVPREFELGKTWVFLAHPRAIELRAGNPRLTEEEVAELLAQPAAGGSVHRPGIITLFKPERIEQIVTDVQAQDAEFMEKLEKAQLTPVVVPADDPDHNPGVKRQDKQIALPLGGEHDVQRVSG